MAKQQQQHNITSTVALSVSTKATANHHTFTSGMVCFVSNLRVKTATRSIPGTYKVRNEIETKRNEINENETKRNETKSTKTKRNETKSTKWKRNETKPTK
jgi:hypothetical protein